MRHLWRADGNPYFGVAPAAAGESVWVVEADDGANPGELRHRLRFEVRFAPLFQCGRRYGTLRRASRTGIAPGPQRVESGFGRSAPYLRLRYGLSDAGRNGDSRLRAHCRSG